MEDKITIQNLDLYYSEFHALKDINMHIREKEITAFIGPSGCGKSTLLRCLNRMNDLVEGCRVTGKVLLNGDDIYLNDDVNMLRKRVGMVFQNPDNQIVANVVEEDVAFAPENLGVPSAEIRKRVDDALEAVGMTQFVKHAPHLLSGGQKQRIAIVRSLAMEPEVLGPAPAPVVKLNNRYRYRITVVGQNEKPLRQLLAAYMKAFARRPEHRNMAVHTDCNLMD